MTACHNGSFCSKRHRPSFQPSATTRSPSPLQGCGLILVAMDDGYTAWDLRKRERYHSNMGLKMCVTKFIMNFSCCFTSHPPSANFDTNTLGNRCAICTPIAYEHALLLHPLSTLRHQQVSDIYACRTARRITVPTSLTRATSYTLWLHRKSTI